MVGIRLPRRNFSVRLRHNALSALEKYKIVAFRAKFRRYALASAAVQNNHPARPIFVALGILNLMRARSIENKVWVNPLPLAQRRNLFINQNFGFEKRQLHGIFLVILIFLLSLI